MDERNAGNIVFLNLSKALDEVSHDILVSKLEIYGLDKIATKHICNWLNNYKQEVIING